MEVVANSLSQSLNIPTVDLGGHEEDSLVHSVAAAAMKWGVFLVVNHGIPKELIKKLQVVGREFFELPEEEKQACAKPTGGDSIEGYGTTTNLQKDHFGKKSWVDFLFHRIWPPSSINYNFWPKNPVSYREVTEEYGKHLREVGDKIFRYLSLGLGLEEHALKNGSGGGDLQFLMKVNYYPPCPGPESTLGLAAHTDHCTLTILVPNEIPGLQVLKDEQWIDAVHVPDALIINIGEQMEILSNGRYKSALHRTTVNKNKTRMSWPVFLEPPSDLEVGPLPQLVDQDNPPKYKTKTFKDYCYCKLNKLPQ